jgi:hypothetical protein
MTLCSRANVCTGVIYGVLRVRHNKLRVPMRITPRYQSTPAFKEVIKELSHCTTYLIRHFGSRANREGRASVDFWAVVLKLYNMESLRFSAK